MSWLFGIIDPAVSSNTVRRCQNVHDPDCYHYLNEGEYYIACGGNRQTCFSGETAYEKSFWIGLGILFQSRESQSSIYTHEEWETIAQNTGHLKGKNGHYIFLKHGNTNFEIKTDALGLRTIYWHQKGKKIVISTRLDWISTYLNGAEIDFQNLGSRWILFNQLTYDSLLKNIHRLGPGGTLTINNGTVKSFDNAFTPPRN